MYFLFPVQKNMEYRDLTFEKFGKAFKSLKRNKAAGHDDIDSNVMIKVYDEISYPLFMNKIVEHVAPIKTIIIQILLSQ